VILHILVEGQSERRLLELWGPRLLPKHKLRLHPHQGKGHLPANARGHVDVKRRGLLDQLPAKLRALGRSLDSRLERVLVLVDADSEDCVALKRRLLALERCIHPCPSVLFRIAVEETEAFYLGDRRAIRAAFSRANLRLMENYAQDSQVGTWEIFRDVIGASGENKVEWATRIAPHLSTDCSSNASPSFRALCRGLLSLAGEPEQPHCRHRPRTKRRETS
jgi:hypothetical protein